MKFRAIIFLSAVAAAMACPRAFAEQLEYSSEVSVRPLTFSVSASLNKFDPALGALKGATLFVDAAIEATSRVENTGPSAAEISVEMQASVSVTSVVLNPAITVPLTAQFGPRLFPGFDGTVDFAGSSGETVLTPVSASRTFVVPAQDLSQYSGSGAIDFTVSATGYTSDSGPGNMEGEYSSSAGAELRIVYQYDPKKIVEIDSCTEVSTPNSITRRIGNVRAAATTIVSRTSKFISKARACGAELTRAQYHQAREVRSQIESVLVESYVPTKLICNSSLCTQSSTVQASRTLRTLARRLSTIQIATKRQAMAACPSKPGGQDNRKNSADYLRELLVAIDQLPVRTRICSTDSKG